MLGKPGSLILLSGVWWDASHSGRGGKPPARRAARLAGEGPLPVKGDSFRIERIPLDNPEEKFWGRFDSAPRPLLRPKERPADLSFGNLSELDGERGLRGTVGRGTGVQGGVLAAIQGVLPCGRRGWGRPGRSGADIGWLRVLRGTRDGGRGRHAGVVVPYERRGTGDGRHAEVVVPYGGKSRKGRPPPGFRRSRRKGVGSFFPATCAAGKIPLTERRVNRTQPQGAGSCLRQSGVRLCRRGLAIVPPCGTGLFKKSQIIFPAACTAGKFLDSAALGGYTSDRCHW